MTTLLFFSELVLRCIIAFLCSCVCFSLIDISTVLQVGYFECAPLAAAAAALDLRHDDDAIILSAAAAAKPTCDYSQQKCGSLAIPYPFSMTDGCGLPGYGVSCRENVSSSLGPGPKAFLTGAGPLFQSQFNVLDISPGAVIVNATAFRVGSCGLPSTANLVISADAPFSLTDHNVFLSLGCNSHGSFSAFSRNLSAGATTDEGPYDGGCSTLCYDANSFPFCNGYACCTVGLPGTSIQSINISGTAGSCGFSTILDPDTFQNTFPGQYGQGEWGLSLGWGFPYTNCSSVMSTPAYACTDISGCLDVGLFNPGRYACSCSRPGYQGDGYKNGTGCESIDECAADDLNNCVESSLHGKCTDLPGSYSCSCVGEDTVGDGWRNGTGCTMVRKNVHIIIGTSFSSAAVVAIISFIVLWVRRVRAARAARARREEYFNRNGGHALMEFLSKAGHDILRVFTEGELKQATQNFAQDRQLGRGGNGTVYKGCLADGTAVAIKRSNHMEGGPSNHMEGGPDQAHQFVNEVIILSKINHRNIVKLLGCCLETPVPLLVYEYIPNGTLAEHLQGKNGRILSWERRIQIALESAEALSYLHSSISTPVFHRDVKSSNILLDKTLTPKIGDFGISRLLPTGDATHVSTIVQGTLGYLDPEYFRNFKLTDKSDVYSFGVVLLELITSLKPIDAERSDLEDLVINLPIFCRSHWKEGTFIRVIDGRLVASSKNPHNVTSSMHAVASLAFACLRVDGKKRPSMKSVFQKLLWIQGSVEDHAGVRRNDQLSQLEEVELSDDDDNDEIELASLIPNSSHKGLSDLLAVSLGQKSSTGAAASSSNALSGFELDIEMALKESFHREGGR